MTDLGRSGADAPSGHSASPEPVVSALRASVPNAGAYKLTEIDFEAATITLKSVSGRRMAFSSGLYAVLPLTEWRALFDLASAIEAQRAETQSGSVHESAVAKPDAQKEAS